MSSSVATISCAAVALAFSLSHAWAEGTNQPLFTIERSKNANVVHYDARVNAEGVLDPKQPVAAYWILLAEDGRRQDLNMVERVKAYGFDIKLHSTSNSWAMTLAAYRKRDITVRQMAGSARAEIVIDGRPSLLDKLYIDSTEGRLLPKVNYIELFGKDLETGEKRYEKILPD